MLKFISQIVFGFSTLVVVSFGDGLAEKVILGLCVLAAGIAGGIIARGD